MIKPLSLDAKLYGHANWQNWRCRKCIFFANCVNVPCEESDILPTTSKQKFHGFKVVLFLFYSFIDTSVIIYWQTFKHSRSHIVINIFFHLLANAVNVQPNIVVYRNRATTPSIIRTTRGTQKAIRIILCNQG